LPCRFNVTSSIALITAVYNEKFLSRSFRAAPTGNICAKQKANFADSVLVMVGAAKYQHKRASVVGEYDMPFPNGL